MKQKGFTLIEVLVALAISGMLMVGIVLSIFQVSWGNIRTNDHITALTDVNYAALWLKKDIQMAQDTSLTDGIPQSSVTLTWTDFTSFEEGNKNHSSSYALSPGTTNLTRTYDGTPRVIGRQITSIGFTQDGKVINVAITATGPGAFQRTKTLEFSVNVVMRPEELQ